MTRIATQPRTPVDATFRGYISRRVLAAVRERQRGLCARCDNRIAEWDHIIPLDLGGANAEANLMGLCTRHHKLKTARDMKAIAKARRIRKREAGETKAKRPIASRPLTHPTLKRGFDNKVVPR